MGIKGLTSFLHTSYLDDVLDEINLHDTFLLIDGNSLIHRFQYTNNIDSAFGGNYDHLARKLNDLFNLFKKCKIEPIVLMDGARDKQDRKFKTILDRAEQRLSHIKQLNELPNDSINNTNVHKNQTPKKQTSGGGGGGGKLTRISIDNLITSGCYHQISSNIMPILSFKVLLKILDEHQITYFQCDFEADYELACLANFLQCPLLSCDSDFFIYDLKYGYISIDFFDFNVRRLCDFTDGLSLSNKSFYYIPVKIYKLDKFIQHFNCSNGSDGYGEVRSSLRKEMLSLFAILCGNDFVNRDVFKSFLNTFDSTNNNLKFRRLKRNAGGYTRRKNSLYQRMLEWLAEFTNLDECLTQMFRFIKLDSHELIRDLVTDSLNDYMCRKPSLANYFGKRILNKYKSLDLLSNQINMLTFSDSDATTTKTVINPDLTTHDGKELSVLFLDKYRLCHIARFGLDILIHRRVNFNCQIELLDWPSTYLSSLGIRKFFYSILINSFEKKRSIDDMKKQSKSSQAPYEIKEYLRQHKEIRVESIYLENEYLSREQCVNIHSINEYFLLESLFQFDSDLIENLFKYKHLSTKLRSFFILIFYWLRVKYDTRHEMNGKMSLLNENCLRALIVSFLKCSLIDQLYTSFKPSSSCNRNLLSKSNETNDSSWSCTCLKSTPSDTDNLIRKFFYFDKSDREFNDSICFNESNNEYIKELHMKLNTYSQFKAGSTQNGGSSSGGGGGSASKLNRFFNLRFVHSYCEFQSIYLSISYVYEILDALAPGLTTDFNSLANLIDINLFYNGCFLHNFTQELEQRSNPDLFIEELFGRKSLFRHLYVQLIKLFKQMFFIEKSTQEVLNENETKCSDKNLTVGDVSSTASNDSSFLSPITTPNNSASATATAADLSSSQKKIKNAKKISKKSSKNKFN